MTPDEMEAVVSARLVEVDAHGGTTPFRNAYFCVDVIRTLLLDYQERGRALEELLALPVAKQAFVYLDKGIGTKTPEAAWLRARATLKGKSHD